MAEGDRKNRKVGEVGSDGSARKKMNRFLRWLFVIAPWLFIRRTALRNRTLKMLEAAKRNCETDLESQAWLGELDCLIELQMIDEIGE